MESSQACGLLPYVEGDISEVRVMCASKKEGGRCGEEVKCEKCEGRVVVMSVFRMGERGWEGGGSSQREEPVIFFSKVNKVERNF